VDNHSRAVDGRPCRGPWRTAISMSIRSMWRMCGGASIKKSPGSCQVSRLERLADRPQAECHKVVNFAATRPWSDRCAGVAAELRCKNRPARAKSRLARLMDRPRAECDTIINFASPSATSPDFELPIKLRFRRQILECCPRERFEIGVYSSSASSSSSSGLRVRIRYDTNCPSSSSLS